MTDVMTAAQRSKCMGKIKGRDTKPEIRLRKSLWRAGLRYRLKSKLTGKPDLIFANAKVAIFVDGCFWHGCKAHSKLPKSNRDFWFKKLSGNIQRDKSVNRELRRSGWTVVRLWEHDVKADVEKIARDLSKLIKKTRL